MELAIVLVIIGLIVGGILVGRDLIASAEVNSAISQIQKYKTAVQTFRLKYNALPGDLNAAAAMQFGFTARGAYTGEGDGNGLLEGVDQNAGNHNWGIYETAGETASFWVDLTTANGLNINLIDGSFSTASPSVVPGGTLSGATLDQYFPHAKIGNNYIYAYSGTIWTTGWVTTNINYFGLSAINSITAGEMTTWPGLTVAQAFAIDTKIDDGVPMLGTVTASYPDAPCNHMAWVSGGTNGCAAANASGPYTTATAAAATSCFDNGGNAGTTQQYSMGQNKGAGISCALSFKMQ